MSSLLNSLTLHKTVRNHYQSLANGTECRVTYVWINTAGDCLRSKTRTLDKEPTGIQDIPEWSASQRNIKEIILVPVRMFRDPFNLDPNKLVLCEVLEGNYEPTESNHRSECAKVMEKAREFEPWFGIEQEYVLLDEDRKPFGWPPQGYGFINVNSAVGINKAHGRDIAISHYKACLYAGVKIFGTNAESLPSMWEFQIGPCEGIEMGDHLWMARYILHRVAEDFGLIATIDTKPLENRASAAGGHTNFSTKEMRSEGGLKFIEEAIRKLSKRHAQHLLVYDLNKGLDNMYRLNGDKSGSSSFHEFSWGVASRNVSVRIPDHVSRNGCGYLEDRRPSANCDPYAVTKIIVETCLLETPGEEDDGEKTTAS